MNTVEPLTIYGDCLFIDNSTLQRLSSCPRKGLYTFTLKKRPNKIRPALVFGSAIHLALETRARLVDQTGFCSIDIQNKMLDKLVEFYQKDENMIESDYRNVNYAVNTIKEYNESYQYDNLIPIEIPDWGPAVELPVAICAGELAINKTILVSDPDVNSGAPFEKHIDKLRIFLTGKIDRIVEYKGGLCILDHKTSSIGGPTFFDEFYTSLQFQGYKFAAEKILKRNVSGVIIDAIFCRPPKADGSVNRTFDRQYIPINSEMLLDWQLSYLNTIKNFIDCHVNQASYGHLAFPRNTSSCVTKYGKCDFFDVCMLAPSQRPFILDSGAYTKDTWSPLDSDSINPSTIKNENTQRL